MRTITEIPPELLTLSRQVSSNVWNTGVAITAIVAGLLIKWIITKFLKYYEKRKVTEYSIFRSIITHLGMPVAYFIPLFLLGLATPLMRMEKEYYQPLTHLINILLTVAFANLVISGIRIAEDYVYHRYDLNKTDNLKERKIRTQIVFIRKLIVAIIVFLTVAVILLSFQSMRKIGTGLLTGVGIGGIIVGLAAQTSLGNLLAGFQIAFTQPLRIDDVLVVEGEWGRVEDITLTYVVMRLWDQRRLILPINYFIQKPFQNWTRVSADILGYVFLYLDYTVPVDELRKEFERLLEGNNLWDGRVKVMQVTDAREHTIQVRMLISAANSSNSVDLQYYLRENMISFIQKNFPGSLPKVRAEFTMPPPFISAIPNAPDMPKL
ncbi:mechanosensitive ion channel family protein [Mucilaginibacter sp. RS28]|uniref:Mechanosensitive ion channel family protein n=1 Tax=Mucilaginibacter straminoryzae TaxID=2932774 RepID=A0A9X1X5Q6_9SPHI|nr:mechanosensitive ion channel domain-containing protein [Mucilaginibacter straminoryzae]MCJ8211539.1 mechanosensitive ion channel family protein [Mucilaginibacter straminoryzae]